MNQQYVIPGLVEPGSSAEYHQKIPTEIIQTFATRDVPEGMYRAARSWTEQNPEYSYRFNDDDACRAFLDRHFDSEVLAAFDRVSAGAFKADLWRYCALYVHGGVYADIDTVCSAPLHALIDEDDEFISPFAGVVAGGIFNAFICSTPGHPFLERAIGKSVTNIMENGANCRHVLELTGPLCLGDAVNELIGRDRDTEFEARRYDENGFRFRILEKVRSAIPANRKVVADGRDVFMCKYEGYGEDLGQAGGSHWSGRQE